MTHIAKDKQHYIAAWNIHVRQLQPLFIASGAPHDKWNDFFSTMNTLISTAANREFADPQRVVPTAE